ncbi:MAG: ABC transporter ATP-binding protein, partial [Planctomycetes bacterium]|nr:ABC transporter ATP-binding protein [Planctomycetota bacterium]
MLLALVVAIALAGGVAGLLQPALVTGLVVQLLSGTEGGMGPLAWILAALFGLQLAGAALHGVHTFVAQKVAFRVQRELRERTFRQLLGLPVGFFRTVRKGEVLSQVTRDLGMIERFLASSLPEVLFRVFLVVLVFGALAWLAPALALLSLVVLPLLSLSVRGLMRRMAPYSQRVRDGLAEIHTFYDENVTGVDLIKAYGQEEERRRRFEAASREFYEHSMKGTRLFAVFPTLQAAVLAAGTVGILAFGVYRMRTGSYEPATLLAAFLYLGTLYGTFQAVAYQFSSWPDFKVSWRRLDDLFRRETESRFAGTARPERLAGPIEFEGVSFSYEEGRPVLDGASFRIGEGERVALVGPSGLGKTTVANLILGFYAPGSGQVRVGGHDVRELDLTFLRSRIAYVDQENFLFDAPLSENVRMGRLEATEAEVHSALAAARLDSFVASLPEGLATRVGTRGARLSMGQRQRVAIARAILKDAPILVLDEYTSNVDPETEREIRAGLAELSRGRTTLVISHRPSTILDVDRIYSLSAEGRIAELSPRDRSEGLLAGASGSRSPGARSFLTEPGSGGGEQPPPPS